MLSGSLPERPLRRALLTVPFAAWIDSIVSAADKRPDIAIPEMFGARGGGMDDTVPLQRALDHCKTSGRSLQLGPRRYCHGTSLVADGASLTGVPGSELCALDARKTALVLTGIRPSARGIHITSPNARTRIGGANGIEIRQAQGFQLSDITVEGSGAAGILVSGARGGVIRRAHVMRTYADGVHVTGGSRDLHLIDIVAEDTGDDGVAVVSYRKDGTPCRDIVVDHCISRRSNARGMTVVGGIGVHVIAPSVDRSRFAGIYFYGESSYDTYGITGCSVEGGQLTGCVLDARPGHAVIMFGGRDGADAVGATSLMRGTTHCILQDVGIQGVGRGARQGISLRRNTSACLVRACRLQAQTSMIGSGFVPFDDKGQGNRLVANVQYLVA